MKYFIIYERGHSDKIVEITPNILRAAELQHLFDRCEIRTVTSHPRKRIPKKGLWKCVVKIKEEAIYTLYKSSRGEIWNDWCEFPIQRITDDNTLQIILEAEDYPSAQKSALAILKKWKEKNRD